ncbi:hypothetical protein M404DRAFT_748516 [Pisolithus tinctorius Marx 270]|uniref:Histone deacetylase domain-containing protein n=1 Tax=Pisolithus tinctorius Marx 270 TaxID=870435 RepID=A0A0C3JSM5_PISTI|nr:hypothetical protein M404DRAFT_748516 [Pisolithus tinctorius Marx 270]
MYLTVCKAVVEDTVTAFWPTAIVLQCGTESLRCDRLGAFNFSIAAHGKCVNFMRKYNVPFMMLGVAVTPLKISVDAGRTRLLFSLAQKYRTTYLSSLMILYSATRNGNSIPY